MVIAQRDNLLQEGKLAQEKKDEEHKKELDRVMQQHQIEIQRFEEQATELEQQAKAT